MISAPERIYVVCAPNGAPAFVHRERGKNPQHHWEVEYTLSSAVQTMIAEAREKMLRYGFENGWKWCDSYASRHRQECTDSFMAQWKKEQAMQKEVTKDVLPLLDNHARVEGLREAFVVGWCAGQGYIFSGEPHKVGMKDAFTDFLKSKEKP
jgi:hypothetical protein